ncbi:MAG TPA: hypothetical protein VIU40_08390 [Geobacteraceae bacterium]
MKPTCALSDAAVCRTRHVYGQVYRCLAAEVVCCPHGLAFACVLYCSHPDAGQFALPARAAMPADIAA